MWRDNESCHLQLCVCDLTTRDTRVRRPIEPAVQNVFAPTRRQLCPNNQGVRHTIDPSHRYLYRACDHRQPGYDRVPLKPK
jgi:hypothetical protein